MLTPWDAHEASGGVDETIYAFPSGVPHAGNTWASDMGMSLRDYFAAKAMDRMIARAERQMEENVKDGTSMDEWECYHDLIAEQSYLIADAMMRQKTKPVEFSEEDTE